MLSLIVVALAVGVAGQAQAGPLGFTGTLAVQIGTLSPLVTTGSGMAGVNGSGGLGHLSTLTVPNSPFQVTGFLVPVTDPAAAPIKGVQATLHNGNGAFGGNPLAGTMPIQGVAKVCLFAPCPISPANITVPLSVVGVGGSATVSFYVNVTVVGAPWTTGTVAINTITAMGFAHGPASLTSSTASPSGAISLVTPIFISTNIASSAVVPAFGFLNLHFVPEPGTLVLLGSGIAVMVMIGRSRRSWDGQLR